MSMIKVNKCKTN